MIYLRITTAIYKWKDSSKRWEVGDVYKIDESKVQNNTYYGWPKYHFEEITPLDALLDCAEHGITIADIKEFK